jgi:hypothetical protein
MQIDKDQLFLLEKQQSITIKISDKSYKVDSLNVDYSDVPVTKPTTRGGVYFSDTMAYKIKVQVSDDNIKKMLSKTMLGPNSDFEKIQLISSIDGTKQLIVFVNLTNYVQRSSGLELNLVVVGTDLA